jgi:hypothetical protein
MEVNKMTRSGLLKVTVLTVIASIAIFTGCDSASGNSDKGSWTVTAPANGAANVVYHATFIIKYSKTLDTTIDDEQLFITCPGASVFDLTLNSSNSTINITGDTVAITMTSVAFASGTEYSGITISGFKDSDLNLIDPYTTSGYSFTTEPK